MNWKSKKLAALFSIILTGVAGGIISYLITPYILQIPLAEDLRNAIYIAFWGAAGILSVLGWIHYFPTETLQTRTDHACIFAAFGGFLGVYLWHAPNIHWGLWFVPAALGIFAAGFFYEVTTDAPAPNKKDGA